MLAVQTQPIFRKPTYDFGINYTNLYVSPIFNKAMFNFNANVKKVDQKCKIKLLIQCVSNSSLT